MDCNWFDFPQAAKDAIQLKIEREEHAKEQARLEQMKEEKALLQREEEERRKVSEIRTLAKLVFTYAILSVNLRPVKVKIMTSLFEKL